MQTIGIKTVSVVGFILMALLAGCSKGNSASTDPGTTSVQQPNSPVALAATVSGADGIAIDNYTLVSSTRVSRTVFEYTYTADVSNWGSGDAAITAALASTAANVTVIQGALDFGNVPLGATQESADTFTIRVDRSQPFNEDALTWTVQATPLPPTTFELIEQAQANGTIDAETALIYKVYDEFKDDRLPALYRGRNPDIGEAVAIREVNRTYDSLSPAAQQTLAPFLIPPEESGSWYQLRLAQQSAQSASVSSVALPASSFSALEATPPGVPDGSFPGFRKLLTDNGKVYIHWDNANYPNDAATAVVIASEINNTIWPRLTALLGEPKPDDDGILDIRLTDIADGRPYTVSTVPGCNGNVPARIYLPHVPTLSAVAHEITHAILYRFMLSTGCNDTEQSWLEEATAKWAEHFVYPTFNAEHDSAPNLLDEPALSLELRNDSHEYGAYLLLFYMTQGDSYNSGTSNPQKVLQIWNALAGVDSLHAINSVMSAEGGLGKAWHDFVLYNWNREISQNVGPVTGGTCAIAGKPYVFYGLWDCLFDKARESTGATPEAVKLNGQVAASFPLTHKINHLGATYFHYDFTQDSTIQRVRLLNPYSGDHTGHVKVQAIVKTDSGWQKAQDWTGLQQKTLCRDKPDEKFRELVIVISNSEFENRNFVLQDNGAAGPVQTKLQVSALGCSNWKGGVIGSYKSGDPNDDITSTTSATDVTFEVSSETWADSSDSQVFKVTGGSVLWKESQTVNFGVTCSGDFEGNYGLANTTLYEAALNLGVNSKPEYSINALMQPPPIGSWTVDPTNYHLSCPELGDMPAELLVGEWFTSYDYDGTIKYPGIYDTAGGSQDGELAGAAGLAGIHRPGDAAAFAWELKKNGTFDSDQIQ